MLTILESIELLCFCLYW